MKPSRLRGIVFLVSGLAALSVVLSVTQFRFVAIVVGLACFLLGATALSQAGQLATSLRPFLKRSVRVQVWGAPLPATDGSTFEVDAVIALGAGLLIHLRRDSGGPRTLLKVAQPSSVQLGDSRVEIGEARYVSWGGRKVKPVVGHPALALLVAP